MWVKKSRDAVPFNSDGAILKFLEWEDMLAAIGLHYNSLLGISIKLGQILHGTKQACKHRVFESTSNVLLLFDGNLWLQDFARQVKGDVLQTIMYQTSKIV